MPRISALIGLGLAAALALTGCAAADVTTPAVDREASTLGTNICITNKTDMNVRIKWRGYPNARPIATGYQSCNSGYETWVTMDVKAVLEYEPTSQPGVPLTLFVEGTNPSIAEARAEVYFARGWQSFGAMHVGDVGDARSFQEGWLRVTITRLPDSDRNKEWDITLTPPSGEDYSSDITNYVHGGGKL
nr:MAG: hypothetical protein GM42_1035 [actinobacterium acMicro-1]